MATLSNADRQSIWKDFMESVSREGGVFGTLTKADILAVVNAYDDFVNTNATTINSSLPQPGRAQLSTSQKARLFMLVVAMRYLKGV